jgi:hypothetical protein
MSFGDLSHYNAAPAWCEECNNPKDECICKKGDDDVPTIMDKMSGKMGEPEEPEEPDKSSPIHDKHKKEIRSPRHTLRMFFTYCDEKHLNDLRVIRKKLQTRYDKESFFIHANVSNDKFLKETIQKLDKCYDTEMGRQFWNIKCPSPNALLDHKLRLLRALVLGVKYADPSKKSKYEVGFAGQYLTYRGYHLDTKKLIAAKQRKDRAVALDKKVTSGVTEVIWVLGTDKVFYTRVAKLARFHHSSFLSGRAVYAAGAWEVSDGNITKINGKSGHYLPPIDALIYAVRLLASKGCLLMESEKVVQVFDSGEEKLVTGEDLIRYKEKWSLCK